MRRSSAPGKRALLNVLLVNPAFSRYGGIVGHGNTMVPLNLCYLAGYGRRQHADAAFKILDAEVLGHRHEETVAKAVEFEPDLIGITANTCVFDSVMALVPMLKARLPNTRVVLGGPHPSALPEDSLIDSGADFAVMGEGELTFAQLIGRVKEAADNFGDIPGLAFRHDDGAVHVNAPRPRIEDLDVLPFPARDLVDNSLYTPPPTKRVALGPSTLIATSRGCPFNCGFCGAKTVWERCLHARSPQSVVDEMHECIARFGIRTFNFSDEFFTAKKSRVLEICSEIRSRGLDIRWVCSARAQKLDFETLCAMKEAGCHEISYGIESGNQEILKRIDKSLKLDEARETIHLTKNAGITTHASYMFGYIGETEDTMRDTLRFAKELNTAVAAFFVASPLPGTRLYHEALEKGYLRDDATWQDYSPLSNRKPVLDSAELSAETVLKWHRRALRTYYIRPRYLLSRLLAIRHWYEIANLFGGLRILFRIK